MRSQRGGSALIAAIIVGILIIGGIYWYTGQQASDQKMEMKDGSSMEEKAMMKVDEEAAMMMEKESPTEDAMMKKMDEAMMEKMSFDLSGELFDVTEGKDVRGINTGGNAGGMAQAGFADGVYSMKATFTNLPDPAGTDFYEGWVVRKSPFDFISTGKLEQKDGQWMNVYSSGQDYTDYDFYVLTLEPDDGDPAPADHIVEGTML